MPALFIKMSTGPFLFLAYFIVSLTFFLLETSNLTARTYLSLLVSALIICLVSSNPYTFTSEIVRFAPNFANFIAINQPSPDPAPVRNI